MPFLVRTIKDS